MNMHELIADNIFFKYKYKCALETFLQTKKDDSDAHSDQGEHVGARVKVTYKGQEIQGTVVSTYEKKGTQRWVVRFSDKYVKHYARNGLQKILIHVQSAKVGRQLDYILVSTRWKSCVHSSCPKWGPAMHRDLHGEKNDHALVECRWKWRIRTVKTQPSKDFNCLYEQQFDDVEMLA